MNKQSILSLKKCALSLGIAAMAAGFTACSEKDMPNGPEAPDQEVSETTVGSPVNVINDPSELDKYVTNYKKNNGSRSVADEIPAHESVEFEMPTLPTQPTAPTSDWIQMTQTSDWANYNLSGGQNLYVPKGQTSILNGINLNISYSDQDKIDGDKINPARKVNIYIYGTLQVPSFAPTQGANIYIAPDGKLELTGESTKGYWDADLNKYVEYTAKNGVLTNDTYTNLYIYEGGSYTGNYTTASKTGLYVEGDVNVGDVEFGGTVRIGGQLTANNLTTNNAKLYAHDIVAETWTYMNDSKVVAQNIQIAGDVEINAQNVAIDCYNYLVGGDFLMKDNSVLYAREHLGVVGDAEISTKGTVYTRCFTVTEKLYIKNDAKVIVPRLIYCGDFEASASGFTINMDGNALIMSNKDFTIQNKDWKIKFDNTADTHSAIVAKGNFQIMEGAAGYISGYAYLAAKEYWGKPSEETQYYVEGDDFKSYKVEETVKVSFGEEKVKVNSVENCVPDFTTPDTPTPPKITELISTIEHTHDISATCVAINNGKAYFSWHKRGTSIHGCLEAGKVENDVLSLTSWMEVNDKDVEGGDNLGGNSAVSGTEETQGQYDYNHLIVAEGQVVTVGDHAKMGGFIGAIALDEAGNFGTNETLQEDAFRSRQLLAKVTDKIGRSGNCVLYANGKYYIACAGGFQEFNVTEDAGFNDLFVWKAYDNPQTESATGYWKAHLGAYELTAGSAKHIAINPDGDKIATLELTAKGTHPDGDDYWFNDTETAISAKLKVRDANNWLKTYEWSAEISDICPIYGKNAIAMDASGNVYVAAGREGLLVYNNGEKVGGFKLPKNVKAYKNAGANGLAVDDNYVYVAYGVGGLWILNKSDLSVVSWYKSNAPEGYETEAGAASANYVALDGKYIYVAYGRHGVKVLKLND